MATPGEAAKKVPLSHSNKRKATSAHVEDFANKKAVRIEAVPGYESCAVQPLPNLNLTKDDQEVWLLQLPHQVSLESLTEGFIDLNEHSNGGLVGELSTATGRKFQLVAAPDVAKLLVAVHPTTEGSLRIRSIQNHIALLPAGLLPATRALKTKDKEKHRDGSSKKKKKSKPQAELL